MILIFSKNQNLMKKFLLTLNFTGSGDNQLKIFATEALDGVTENFKMK